MIIADIGVNHCGRRELMEEMIKRAAEVGIDIVKFQSFRADKLKRSWPEYQSAYEFFKQHELSKSDHEFIMQKCKENKIEFLTTVFDMDTANYLNKFGLQRVKIASPDCNNWKLIGRCLNNFEQVIISTGMHSIREVKYLAKRFSIDIHRMIVLHCVSLYPTLPEQANMLRIGELLDIFPYVGYSDHTIGTDAAKFALSWQVCCLEKHFTLDKNMAGPDHKLSATPEEFAELIVWRDKVARMLISNKWDDEHMRGHINKWND